MFTEENTIDEAKPEALPTGKAKSTYVPFLNGYNSTANMTETNYNTIDQLLEKEKLRNKTETWNKLDKSAKIQKLHAFAEKYGKEHALPSKDIKNLKVFFIECLDKGKHQKAKDVVYDKEAQELSSIPALFFNMTGRNFTLKIVDSKRVSTLKSLTPKRDLSEKNKEMSQILS
jgi:hypothetical protein